MVAVAGKVSALCTSQMSHTVDTYLKLKPFGHVRLAHVSIGDAIWLVMAVKAGGRQHAREARRGRGQDTVEKCMIAKTYACTKSEKAAGYCRFCTDVSHAKSVLNNHGNHFHLYA